MLHIIAGDRRCRHTAAATPATATATTTTSPAASVGHGGGRSHRPAQMSQQQLRRDKRLIKLMLNDLDVVLRRKLRRQQLAKPDKEAYRRVYLQYRLVKAELAERGGGGGGTEK
jgi:hypothetical protein